MMCWLVLAASERAAQECRSGKGPVLLELADIPPYWSFAPGSMPLPAEGRARTYGPAVTPIERFADTFAI